MKTSLIERCSAFFHFKGILFVILILISLASCKKEEVEEIDPQRNILFQEDFNNNDKNWPIIEDSAVITSLENGKYYIEHTIADLNSYFYIYINSILNNEYTIETSFNFIEGVEDFMYGLIWFRKDSFNHYYLYFNDNKFLIGYIYNYKHHLISDWTESESIKLNGEQNKIELKISGSHFDLFINDDLVYGHDAEAAIGKKAGFKVRSKGKIAIDDILMYW